MPKSVPTPTLPTTHDAATDKPVLLYSDTNAWCMGFACFCPEPLLMLASLFPEPLQMHAPIAWCSCQLNEI